MGSRSRRQWKVDKLLLVARELRARDGGVLAQVETMKDADAWQKMRGPTVFAHACRFGAEGMISKKVDATYRSGPCLVWVKAPQSGQHRAAAGAQREVERMIRDFPDEVAGPSLRAPRPRRLIDLL
jgi:hypothetical protein